ncbi:hypothetical protein FGO68_gene16932 [Halteria grandinella]|uniref:Uncharacterized protein n=1 Tax=Halteria grandinella TaxID=5974 RepID=A0A8J8NM55_HALGN|nr:hypothetical protein FGO68_gene16932 [Halteria grandinella]
MAIKFIRNTFYASVYGTGAYKLTLLFGVPLYHLYHQLSTDTQESPIFTHTQGTYVAVSGCTDGIGKALTLEFARRGYGAYLLARNFEKLDNLQNELKQLTPANLSPPSPLTPKWLKIDFSKASLEEYREIFATPLQFEGSERQSYQHGEVSIMVNNVGTGMTNRPVFECEPQEIETLIKTNIYSYVMCTKHFISEVKKYREGKQSYIIYISSIVADLRNPFSTAFYQASKLSNKVFAHTTYYPRSLSIDYLIIKPGWVSTNLTKNRAISLSTASQQEETQAIFKSISFTRDTYAQWKHLALILATNAIPQPVYEGLFGYLKEQARVKREATQGKQ